MEIQYINTTQANESSYIAVNFKNGKELWQILRVIGKLNYVSIEKLYPNPFCGGGARFENFDKAQERYKSPKIKTMILMAEEALNRNLILQ